MSTRSTDVAARCTTRDGAVDKTDRSRVSCRERDRSDPGRVTVRVRDSLRRYSFSIQPSSPAPRTRSRRAGARTIGIFRRWRDVLEALRGAVVAPAHVPEAAVLVSIDPTYPTDIKLPQAIIALEPNHGIPLPAGDVGILAGQGGERKSTLTIQMAIAAAAAEDGALVSPFTGLAVNTDDPFTVHGGVGLAVCGGPVCMATWEDAAPWLAVRARAIAAHLDSCSELHTAHAHPDRRQAPGLGPAGLQRATVRGHQRRMTATRCPTSFQPAGIACGTPCGRYRRCW